MDVIAGLDERADVAEGEAEAVDPLDAEIQAVLAGDRAAWPMLAARLHQQVLAICRRRRYAAGSPSAGDVHREVALRALERLRADDHAALRGWADARARYPSARFGAWLGAVVGHLFVDHQRGSPDFVRRRRDGRRVLEAVHSVELDDSATDGADPAMLAEVARIARALIEPGFPEAQREAVALWLRGEDADAIARALGLPGAVHARRLLQAARERLRRRFAEDRS